MKSQILVNDLFSVDENISETIVYKRIQIENKIRALNSLREVVHKKLFELVKTFEEWESYLQKKSELPKSIFTEQDKDKLKL